jgi:hypothetical protein
LAYGINKDAPDVTDFVPHHADFIVAYAAASKATIAHLEYTTDLLGSNVFKPFTAGDSTQTSPSLSSLFPIGPSVAFGISGQNQASMINEMGQGIKPLVESVNQSAEKNVKQYILSTTSPADEATPSFIRGYATNPVNETNTLLMTTSGSTLLNEFDQISKSGIPQGFNAAQSEQPGCSELSIAQLRNMVMNTNGAGQIFFYTDAESTGEEQALAEITALALKKHITLNYLTTRCASNDLGLMQSANQTGGELVSVDPVPAVAQGLSAFNLGQSVSNNIQKIIQPVTDNNLQSILIISAETDEEVTHLIPVDSSMSNLVISIQHDTGMSITLVEPNGQAIDTSNNNIEITTLENTSLITIEQPETGEWQLSLAAEAGHHYGLHVKTQSNIGLPVFELFEKRKSYLGALMTFPLSTENPLIGQRQCQAIVTGEISQVEFEMKTVDGQPTQTFNLQQLTNGAPRFKGSIDIPDQALRVYVTGLDENGLAFSRVYPRTFQGSSIGLSLNNMVASEVAAGQSFSASLAVSNHNQKGTFQVTIADQLGLFNQQFSVSLDPGVEKSFDVKFAIPDDIADDAEIVLTITTSEAGGSGQVNRLVQSLFVINPEIADDNTPVDESPTLHISSPAQNSKFDTEETIQLQAQAIDPEDGDISQKIQWQSNLHGGLGQGESLSKVLSVGTHTIRASVADSANNAQSDSVQIEILPKTPITLTATSKGFWRIHKATLTWSGTDQAVDIYQQNKVLKKHQTSGSRGIWFFGEKSFKVCESKATRCSEPVTLP